MIKVHKQARDLHLRSLFESEEEKEGKKSSEYEFLIGDPSLKILIKNKSIKIEFYEHRPPHSRQILSSQIAVLFETFESLKKTPMSKLENSSWFSVLWSPMKSSKSIFMNTSFITYYQFDKLRGRERSGSLKEYSELTIIGVLPIKFENKLFLSRIMNVNALQYPIYGENNGLLKSSIVSYFFLFNFFYLFFYF